VVQKGEEDAMTLRDELDAQRARSIAKPTLRGAYESTFAELHRSSFHDETISNVGVPQAILKAAPLKDRGVLCLFDMAPPYFRRSRNDQAAAPRRSA
jgi:hypothetical protein